MEFRESKSGYGEAIEQDRDAGNRRLTVISGICVAVGIAGAALGAFQSINAGIVSAKYEGDMKEVVVAVSDVEPGTEITDSMVAIGKVPSVYVPADAVTDPSEVVGKTAAAELTEGIPVGSTEVSGYDWTGVLGTSVEEGKVAVSVSLDAQGGLSPLLHAGERVDVIGCLNGSSAETIADNVRVLSISDETSGGATSSTITLEVSPESAGRITEIQTAGGNIRCAALHADGAEESASAEK